MNNGTGLITNNKSARRKVLIMAFVLLIIIMSFTGFVNYMTFADNYNNSLASTYAVAGNESVRKIEYAIHYGKPIDNYYGMNDTLQELKEVIPELEEVNIVSPAGEILYDLNGFVRNSRLPEKLTKAAVFQQGLVNENLSCQFHAQKVYLFLRISDNNSRHMASLAMVFPESAFLRFNSHFTLQLLSCLAVIAVIALVLLTIIFFRTRFVNRDDFIDPKKLMAVFIAVLGAAQLAYGGLNYYLFKNAYVDMAHTSKQFLQNIVERNIAGVYAKGLSLENIQGFDEYLDSINSSLPQIEDIALVQSGQINSPNAPPRTSIHASVSNEYINQAMLKILLDILTVLIISIFFMVEMTLLFMIVLTRNKGARRQTAGPDIKRSHGLVRSLTYFVNLCACMSLTFVPVVMSHLYQPLLGLSRDVVLSLPLAAEMLGGILAIIFAGWCINKQGWKNIICLGALLLATGNLLSGIGTSALFFIFCRAMAGFGLGCIMMVIRSLVVSLPENNAAIAEFSAGSIAGLNCGAVIGGLLADRLGYDTVFYLAAFAAIIPFIFVHGLMTGFNIEARETSDTAPLAKFYNFIADKKAIIFLLCIFIPYFMSGAFLDYYFPLFATGNGLSQSDISRGFLLNGLFIIYLGPVLTKYTVRKLGDARGMIVSMSIVIAALAAFMLFGTIPAAFVTIVLLGIAESFGVSLKTTYFLNLKGIRDMEINQGIAFFSIMVNFSRMAGPVIYGMALCLGARMGVGLISLVLLMLLLVFIFSARFKPAPGNAAG